MYSRPLYINGRFLSQTITGTQRYSHEVLRQMDSILVAAAGQWPQVELLVPPGRFEWPEYRRIGITAVGAHKGQIWEQTELPYYARGGVLFTPCGGAPIVHPRNVITIHDASVSAWPAAHRRRFRIWYASLYRALCDTALHILTVSQFSKDEMVRYWRADPTKITVTYLGSEHAPRSAAKLEILARLNLKPRKYVLTASSNALHKNGEGLKLACPLLRVAGLELVVAGPRNTKVFRGQVEFPPEVIQTGYVDDGELRALLENAAGFVFPSFYEGFGLPPLEAMALGCPAVVSQTTSLTEVFGSLAFLCDPHDPSDIAAKAIEASQAPQEYRERCKDFAAVFQWERCARITLRTLSELCVESPEVRSPAYSFARGWLLRPQAAGSSYRSRVGPASH